MKRAIELAKQAATEGEVPVAAVLVDDQGEIIFEAYNKKEQLNDPTGHAEILLLKGASQKLGKWRLSDYTVVSTLEPCFMCAGALSHARIKRCVFGAFDQKFGAMGSLYNIPADERLNHRFEAISGVLEQECRQLLVDFFKQKR
ncbi:nucleoside deaminase [bacterium]|nr:nucleoside deaminase [bacterium]